MPGRNLLIAWRERVVGLSRAATTRGTSARRLVLLGPLVALLVGFFLVPMLYMVRMSLNEQATNRAFAPGLTLENYVEILTSEFVWQITQLTFTVATVATVVTILLAVPYAYAIWRADSPLVRGTLQFATVLALLVTLVAKLYAWLVLLAPGGVVNEALLAAGVVDRPLALVNNELGVVVGIVYTAFPYAVLAIYAVLANLDETVLEAAQDLGATRPRAFREVVLPSALPGVAVAAVIAFVWGIGAYAAPALLGSSSEHTYALEVDALMISQFNWPLGAALSMVVLGIVAVGVVVLAILPGRGERA